MPLACEDLPLCVCKGMPLALVKNYIQLCVTTYVCIMTAQLFAVVLRVAL